MFKRNWTRRRALAAGGLALLGLAGCGPQHTAQVPGSTTSGTAVPHSDLKPTLATELTTPITVGFTGDVMFGRTVNDHMLATTSNDPYPFTHTAELLRGFDLTVGNLECVISQLGAPVPKSYNFRGDARAYDRLLNAGFDVVSVANNHSGDYGKDAFLDEFLTLPKRGIIPVGGGQNKQQAHTPIFKRVHNTTLGVLAYEEIDPFSFAATATAPGNAWLTAPDLQADIAAARPSCDFLIAFVHWGIEYVTTENSQQRSLAQVAIDAGADLVVGAHPHVIQPYEFYKNKLIIYSLGNFVFDGMYDEVRRLGNILSLTIQKNQLLSWKLVPTRIGDWGEPNLL